MEDKERVVEVDLKEIFRILWKWRVLIGVLTAFALVLAGILSYFVMSPVYGAKTVLMVMQPADQKQVIQKQEDLEGLVNTVSRLPELTMNSYVSQLKNEKVISRVLDSLQIGDRYSVLALQNIIQVTAVKDTNLIEVTVENVDAKLAADICNSLSKEFLNFLSENNTEQLKKSVGLLEKQIADEDQNLKTASDKLTEFLNKPSGVAYLEQELKNLMETSNKCRGELAQAEIDLQQYQSAKAQLETSLAQTPEKIKDQSVPANVYNKTPNKDVPNPEYTALKQLYNEKTVALAETQARLSGLQSSVAKLDKEIQFFQEELNTKKSELEPLQKEYDRFAQTHKLLQDQITETRIASSISLGETRILVVSPAMIPNNPIKPNKMLNMAIALVIGMIASAGVAFLIEYLDNTIKTPEDVRRHLDLPILGSIPHVSIKAK